MGKTMFANALITEIVNGVMTINPTAQNSDKPPKPAVYDNLKAQSDLTSIASMVNGMTDNEKSQSLVYALWEKADNAVIIKVLAENTPTVETESMKKLGYLASTSQLDSENCQALLGVSNVPWVQGISVMLNL